MNSASEVEAWPWAHSAYLRFLLIASAHRQEIKDLLGSGVDLRRIESLYPFVSKDFEQAIVGTMLASEATAQRICEIFEGLNSMTYADLLLSQYAPSEAVDQTLLDFDRLASALPKAEPRYTELLSSIIVLSQIPTVLFLLPKVDYEVLSAAAVRNDYAGLMILMEDLPRLELALNEFLDALEAHETSTPPPLR